MSNKTAEQLLFEAEGWGEFEEGGESVSLTGIVTDRHKLRDRLATGRPNDFQTPPEALDPLLPYINPCWRVWEPAAGEGNLSRKLRRHVHDCLASDIKGVRNGVHLHKDFLNDAPYECFQCIITNPPYSHKTEFLARCYELGKPFALLMPLTTIGGKARKALYQKHGIQVLLLPDRIAFETPSKGKSSPWFETAWFTHGLNIPDTAALTLRPKGVL